MAFCANCGAKVGESDKFCGSCGATRVPGAPAGQVPPPPPPPPPPVYQAPPLRLRCPRLFTASLPPIQAATHPPG